MGTFPFWMRSRDTELGVALAERFGLLLSPAAERVVNRVIEQRDEALDCRLTESELNRIAARRPCKSCGGSMSRGCLRLLLV